MLLFIFVVIEEFLISSFHLESVPIWMIYYIVTLFLVFHSYYVLGIGDRHNNEQNKHGS